MTELGSEVPWPEVVNPDLPNYDDMGVIRSVRV